MRSGRLGLAVAIGGLGIALSAPALSAGAGDPTTTPPLHGTNGHGEGTVAVVDLSPDPKRPYSSDPTGKTDGEEIVVGRSRGEQGSDGAYHGHITIVGLFGNEVVGTDTHPGETKQGPLDAVQTGLLNPLCNGTSNQVCLSVLRADSSTTGTGSTNHFSVAHATLGGASGIDAGAAESDGNISSDGTCQTSHGDSQAANVTADGGAVASLARSSTDAKACNDGQAPTHGATSSVLGLGGTGVPIPAAGCADGTPDTLTGIPTVLPLVCNADDSSGQTSDPYAVREALDAFVLATGTTAAGKLTTAGSDSRAVAPTGASEGGTAQCSDGIDNDGDGLIDAKDPGCHTDGNPNNPGSYVPGGMSESNGGSAAECSDGKDNDGDGLVDAKDPGCHSDGNANNPNSYNANDTSETNGGNPAECSDGKDNDGDGLIDARDPGCHRDGNANNASSYNPNDQSELNGPAECSDGRDNDGDGLIDARDPGCHSDGNANNPSSYNPDDQSELNGPAAASLGTTRRLRGNLPYTGSDLPGDALVGALILSVGLALRARTARRRGAAS